MSTCKKCIVQDKSPNIKFEDGVCEFCLNHEKVGKININILGDEKFAEKVKSQDNSQYDCAVPLSGGKDSTYILYYVVKKLGLKPVALFFDNGFIVDEARHNVETACRILGVDLVVGHANIFRKRQIKEALLLSKSLGKFVKICGNCENNLRSFVINESKSKKVPFIIYGSTRYENNSESYLKSEVVLLSNEFGKLRSMLGKIKKGLKIIGKSKSFKNPGTIWHASRFLYYCIRDNIASKAPESFLKKLNPFLEVSFEGKDIETVFFYDYVAYDPYKQIKILKEELDWKSPDGKESRMDCRLHAFGNYQDLVDTGLTSDGFTLSVLVRNGLISKEEALLREEKIKKNLKKECNDVAEEVGMKTGVL